MFDVGTASRIVLSYPGLVTNISLEIAEMLNTTELLPLLQLS